jgi:hypothetical protein
MSRLGLGSSEEFSQDLDLDLTQEKQGLSSHSFRIGL